MESTTTIKEVARVAGTSPATVSRVLNGVTSVDPDIAQRVRKASESLNYQPNLAGRNLRMGVDLEFGPDFELRSRQNEDVKRQIAAQAAKWIQASDVIVMDSGSTVAHMVPYLPENVLVYTNSLAILQPAAKRQLSIHLSPGLYVPTMAAVFGPETESYFARRKATKYFLSSTRVDVKTGLFNGSEATFKVKQVIMTKAEMTILLVDHSKFCDSDLPSYAPLREVDLLITDYVPASFRESLYNSGIQIVEIDTVGSMNRSDVT